MAGQFPVQHGFNHAFSQLVHQAMLAHDGFGIALEVFEQFVEQGFLFFVSLAIFSSYGKYSG